MRFKMMINNVSSSNQSINQSVRLFHKNKRTGGARQTETKSTNI